MGRLIIQKQHLHKYFHTKSTLQYLIFQGLSQTRSMPDLCRLVRMSSSRCPKKRKPATTPKKPDLKMKKPVKSKSFDDHLNDWIAKKKTVGIPESKLLLPFLVGAQKLGACRVCENVIYPGDGVSCCMNKCGNSYHSRCARERFGSLRSSKDFKCPQHECYLCKKKTSLWKCSRCDFASHKKCAAYPEYVVHSDKSSGEIICWRHSIDSPPLKCEVPTSSIEEVFGRLPLPYMEKEFKIDRKWKYNVDNMPEDLESSSFVDTSRPINNIKDFFHRLVLLNVEEEFKIDRKWRKTTYKEDCRDLEPAPYVHIKRNIYHIKEKKGYDVDNNSGCTTCGIDICSEDCICRNQYISCTNACGCSKNCTNRPFDSKRKKVKVIKTQHCGWGLEALEFIKEGDFVIEYIGEVIDDASCEKRFWDMKEQGITKAYVVAVRKDFNVDAKFKGNLARFINHSCDPNCIMQKWEVKGKTRLAIFATKPIEPREELTLHYGYEVYGRLVEVKCHCGASNCHGYLGTKRS